MTNLRLLCVVALASRFLTSTIPATEVKEIAYPDGYRNWVHVKSAVIGSESAGFARFGGMHHIYANDKAMEGYRTGHFPDGSILVFDRLEAPVSQGVTTEGARQAVDDMLKDAAFGPTGGGGTRSSAATAEPSATRRATAPRVTRRSRITFGVQRSNFSR